MSSGKFRPKNFRSYVSVSLFMSFMSLYWIYQGLSDNWISVMLNSVVALYCVFEANTYLIVDSEGLSIHRIFRDRIHLAWSDIAEKQHLNIGKYTLDYLLLNVPNPSIKSLNSNQIPKELRSSIFRLDLWERSSELIELVEPYLSTEHPSNQFFVPFNHIDQTRITRISILVIIVAFAVAAFTIWRLFAG